MTELDNVPADRNAVELASVFAARSIQTIPLGLNKWRIIDFLLSSLVGAQNVPQEAVSRLSAQLKREPFGTTEVGNGIAFRHARTVHVDDFFGAVGIVLDEVDFRSIDGVSTKLVFLFLSPNNETKIYRELVYRLHRVMDGSSLQTFLRVCRPRLPREVFCFLRDFDIETRNRSVSCRSS